MRHFSPYEGHCWANGMANEPFGVDEESSPESLNGEAALLSLALDLDGNGNLASLAIAVGDLSVQ